MFKYFNFNNNDLKKYIYVVWCLDIERTKNNRSLVGSALAC